MAGPATAGTAGGSGLMATLTKILPMIASGAQIASQLQSPRGGGGGGGSLGRPPLISTSPAQQSQQPSKISTPKLGDTTKESKPDGLEIDRLLKLLQQLQGIQR